MDQTLAQLLQTLYNTLAENAALKKRVADLEAALNDAKPPEPPA